MTTSFREAVYHEIIWTCHLCGKSDQIKYGSNYDPKNLEELEFEVRMGHEKVESDHFRLSPNCPARGIFFFDISVEQFPPGFYNQ